MEDILQRLNLATLIEKFKEERIDVQVILASSDNELSRLGICTIGDRVRLRELCRTSVEAADNIPCSSTSSASEGVASRVQNERNLLFAPSSCTRPTRARNASGRGKNKTAAKAKRPWTVHVVCLADRLSVKVPNAIEKQVLHAAGLGSKKIKLDLDDDEQTVLDKLTSAELKDEQTVGFPRLKSCGGFEMMVCTANCRQLSTTDCAWNAQSIKASLGGGQAKIYLRPIQKSLSTKASTDTKCKSALKEKCKMCDEEVLLCDLRVHFMLCSKSIIESDLEDNDTWANGDKRGLSDAIEAYTSNANLGPSGSAAQPIAIDREADAAAASISGAATASASGNINAEPSGSDHAQVITIDIEVEPAGGGDSISSEGISLAHAQTHPCNELDDIEKKISEAAQHCRQTSGMSTSAANILRYLQTTLLSGRALEITSPGDCPEGVTNFVMVDRQNLLQTAFDEIEGLENKFITLEIQFYNEQAQDYGGPRKEFFLLCLRAIKEKYFDLGLQETVKDDYLTVGLIMGMSILQNGKLPKFLGDHTHEIFNSSCPSPCLLKLQEGLKQLGIYQMCKELPVFISFFQPSPAATLTLKKVTTLLKPVFSEDGSNQRKFEGEVYSQFLKYIREAASGRRGSITLGHVLCFATATDEEPVLGYSLEPSLLFIQSASFLPTSNTCINCMKLPRGSIDNPLPSKEVIFNLYDYAFANSYFGLI